MDHHENLSGSISTAGASDRSFGQVFAGFFTIVGAYRFFVAAADYWWWWVVAAVFAVAAGFIPRVLAPLNRVWTAFGLVLHGMVSPVILALLYMFAILPTALVVRVVGKDLLRLSRDPDATTYWITRGDAGETGSMKDQF